MVNFLPRKSNVIIFISPNLFVILLIFNCLNVDLRGHDADCCFSAMTALCTPVTNTFLDSSNRYLDVQGQYLQRKQSEY